MTKSEARPAPPQVFTLVKSRDDIGSIPAAKSVATSDKELMTFVARFGQSTDTVPSYLA